MLRRGRHRRYPPGRLHPTPVERTSRDSCPFTSRLLPSRRHRRRWSSKTAARVAAHATVTAAETAMLEEQNRPRSVEHWRRLAHALERRAAAWQLLAVACEKDGKGHPSRAMRFAAEADTAHMRMLRPAGGGQVRIIVRFSKTLVALSAAALSFQSLMRLGRLCGYGSLAGLDPVMLDLGAAPSCTAWLHARSRQALGMTWGLLGCSVALNGTVHYLDATRTTPVLAPGRRCGRDAVDCAGVVRAPGRRHEAARCRSQQHRA